MLLQVFYNNKLKEKKIKEGSRHMPKINLQLLWANHFKALIVKYHCASIACKQSFYKRIKTINIWKEVKSRCRNGNLTNWASCFELSTKIKIVKAYWASRFYIHPFHNKILVNSQM